MHTHFITLSMFDNPKNVYVFRFDFQFSLDLHLCFENIQERKFHFNFTDPLMHPTAWRRTTSDEKMSLCRDISEVRLGEAGRFCEKDSNFSMYSHLEVLQF